LNGHDRQFPTSALQRKMASRVRPFVPCRRCHETIAV
jgi:hypothetical protein